MAMSELKQKLLLYELSKIGFRDAQYNSATDRIHVQPDNDRMPKINNEGGINYATEYGSLAVNTLRPLADRVNEASAAWEKSSKMPFEDLNKFRVLAEYNGVMMAARDDTAHGSGLHFVTWQYNRERTGLDHGHYTEDYNACKEDFAVRCGLVSPLKLFTPEQAAEIKEAIEYRLENDSDFYLSYVKEAMLNSIAARLRAAYPDKNASDIDGEEIIMTNEAQIEITPTAKTINDYVQPNDLVIAAGNNDYRYLVGKVTEIYKFGSPEHSKENTTDEIYVDFTDLEYPKERIAEIEAHFSNLYGESKTFRELPLEDVLMPPETLICISHLSDDEIIRMAALRENCEKFCNYFISPSQNHGAKFDELVNRVDKNLADYHKILDGFGQGELIEMASRIDAMSEAYNYLTACYDFDAEELDFYLQFENPLEIVADELMNHRNYTDDLEYTMESINDRRELILTEYPLIKEANTIVAEKLPEVEKPSEKPEQPAVKPKTLAEKLQVANEKVKAQNAQNNDKKSHKRDERD